MFNYRKRSNRKGPPNNQIYVPHDQRLLNQRPIPITNEYQAQYYLEQLKNMGYIPEPIVPDIQVFKIATSDDTYGINFQIDASETVIWRGSLPQNLLLTDINDQPLDPVYYDQIADKLNQNGYKTYPIFLLKEPRMYNDSENLITAHGMYNNATTTLFSTTIQPNNYTAFSYIQTAKVSHAYQSVYMIDADTDYEESANHVGAVRIAGGAHLWHFSVKALVLMSVKTT